jgi:hypothetical protein
LVTYLVVKGTDGLLADVAVRAKPVSGYGTVSGTTSKQNESPSDNVAEEKECRNHDFSAETPPPIQAPWARLTESLEPNSTQSQPTDELDTEISEAEAQLANLIRQRRLIELQQQVSDEQVALEVARERLAATSSKDCSPTCNHALNDSVNR